MVCPPNVLEVDRCSMTESSLLASRTEATCYRRFIFMTDDFPLTSMNDEDMKHET